MPCEERVLHIGARLKEQTFSPVNFFHLFVPTKEREKRKKRERVVICWLVYGQFLSLIDLCCESSCFILYWAISLRASYNFSHSLCIPYICSWYSWRVSYMYTRYFLSCIAIFRSWQGFSITKEMCAVRAPVCACPSNGLSLYLGFTLNKSPSN